MGCKSALGPKSNSCGYMDLLGFRTCSGSQFSLPKLLNLTGLELWFEDSGFRVYGGSKQDKSRAKKLAMQFHLLKLPS